MSPPVTRGEVPEIGLEDSAAVADPGGVVNGVAHDAPSLARPPVSGERARPWPAVSVQGDLSRARREWLHTNGAGAYASSTIAGMHTRRYHGLLVAALDPPRDRHVFLSHVDATVIGPMRPVTRGASGARGAGRPIWELAKHQFPRLDPTTTPFYLSRFDQDPLPRWTYAIADGELEVTLALVRGENAIVLRYAFRGATPLDLKLRPLIAARPFHQLQREHGGMVQRVELRPTDGAARPRPCGEMRVQPRRELPRICFHYEGTFVGSPDWWRRFEYLAEHERGLDFEEDLWTPGVFEVPLREGSPVWLMAGVERLPEGEPEAQMEASRAALLADDPGDRTPLVERKLTIAAGAFRADLAARPGVIAGYPWFEVWGRGALISLPGLYLVTGRRDQAIAMLRALIAAMVDGLVPSRFPEPHNGAGSPAGARPPGPAGVVDYGSADATLWLFEAARHVADELGPGDPFVAGELLPALRDAFEAALHRTNHGIHVSDEGLFVAEREGDALTWMDARIGGKPITPRGGCAIELSALWARGAETLSELARAGGDGALADRAANEARRTRAAFHDRFWCDETGFAFDAVPERRDGGAPDASVRPNAVVALAIDPACFTEERAARLLERARRELVTPAGLRTLAPSDARYAGRYGGDMKARDAAYHQGAAWPFLLGFYARAALRAGVEDAATIERLICTAAQNEIALGHTPELADGDAPHVPGGAVAHASSVGELLRVLAWDLPRAKKR